MNSAVLCIPRTVQFDITRWQNAQFPTKFGSKRDTMPCQNFWRFTASPAGVLGVGNGQIRKECAIFFFRPFGQLCGMNDANQSIRKRRGILQAHPCPNLTAKDHMTTIRKGNAVFHPAKALKSAKITKFAKHYAYMPEYPANGNRNTYHSDTQKPTLHNITH